MRPTLFSGVELFLLVLYAFLLCLGWQLLRLPPPPLRLRLHHACLRHQPMMHRLHHACLRHQPMMHRLHHACLRHQPMMHRLLLLLSLPPALQHPPHSFQAAHSYLQAAHLM